jgi:hypothetical protein
MAAIVLLKDKIKDVLETLTERERQVLEQRFGLVDGYSRTLEEVGRQGEIAGRRVQRMVIAAVTAVAMVLIFSQGEAPALRTVQAILEATLNSATPPCPLSSRWEGETRKLCGAQQLLSSVIRLVPPPAKRFPAVTPTPSMGWYRGVMS